MSIDPQTGEWIGPDDGVELYDELVEALRAVDSDFRFAALTYGTTFCETVISTATIAKARAVLAKVGE